MKKLKLLIIILLLQESSIFASGQNSRCYKVDYLEIQGVYNLSLLEVNKLKRKYKNNCIKASDLKDLIRIITNLYIDAGYITTRVSIPEQNLNERRLVVKVHEGIVESIESSAGEAISKNLSIQENQILNLRDVEQTVDILNKSYRGAKISLKPGKSNGSTIIVVDNTPIKKWHISTGVDNAGSKNKGRNQSFTNFKFNNLLGIHESYDFGYRVGLGSHKESFMRSYSSNISMPYGYNNFSFSYNDALYRTFIETPKNKYNNKGGSKIIKVTIDRVIHRNRNSKTNLIVGSEHDDYSNYIDDNKIEMSTYRLTKFDIGIRHQRRLTSSVLNFGLQYTNGEKHRYKTNLSHLSTPDKFFHKFNYNLTWQKSIFVFPDNNNLFYQLSVLGQYSPEILVISEKNTMGGLSSVRGFKDYIENADSGIVARNELSTNLPFVRNQIFNQLFGEISIFTGFDFGEFVNHEEKGIRSGTMSGISLGIRNSNGYVNFSATVAKALESPIQYDAHKPVVYLSVSMDL